MNYKAGFLLFSILCLGQQMMAQNEKRQYTKQVKIAPWRFIDPVHSGIELSYEMRHSNAFSTQVTPAYLFTTVFNREYKNYKGFKFGVEEKYFFPNQFVPATYVSAELIYQVNKFSTVQRFVHDSTVSSSQFNYIDTVSIHRRATIFNIRVGRQIIDKWLIVDLSIGIGVRFRNVTHDGKLYPGDNLLFPRHPNVHYHANTEKNDAALNIPLNIRLGFMF